MSSKHSRCLAENRHPISKDNATPQIVVGAQKTLVVDGSRGMRCGGPYWRAGVMTITSYLCNGNDAYGAYGYLLTGISLFFTQLSLFIIFYFISKSHPYCLTYHLSSTPSNRPETRTGKKM